MSPTGDGRWVAGCVESKTQERMTQKSLAEGRGWDHDKKLVAGVRNDTVEREEEETEGGMGGSKNEMRKSSL